MGVLGQLRGVVCWTTIKEAAVLAAEIFETIKLPESEEDEKVDL